MMYLATVVLVTANKTVSYKSVYIFTQSKFCSICLVFMYTHWFSGYFFQAGDGSYMGVNMMSYMHDNHFSVHTMHNHMYQLYIHASYTLLSSLL